MERKAARSETFSFASSFSMAGLLLDDYSYSRVDYPDCRKIHRGRVDDQAI